MWLVSQFGTVDHDSSHWRDRYEILGVIGLGGVYLPGKQFLLAIRRQKG